MARPTFEQACMQYPHRFTMDFAPEWASRPRPDGTYYAPQYRSDREWYENTTFPGEGKHSLENKRFCQSAGQTWPLGNALDKPYKPGEAR